MLCRTPFWCSREGRRPSAMVSSSRSGLINRGRLPRFQGLWQAPHNLLQDSSLHAGIKLPGMARREPRNPELGVGAPRFGSGNSIESRESNCASRRWISSLSNSAEAAACSIPQSRSVRACHRIHSARAGVSRGVPDSRILRARLNNSSASGNWSRAPHALARSASQSEGATLFLAPASRVRALPGSPRERSNEASVMSMGPRWAAAASLSATPSRQRLA
jgi:hypothetical protein